MFGLSRKVKESIGSIVLIPLASLAAAAQQPPRAATKAAAVPYKRLADQVRPFVVSVAHTIDLEKLITRVRRQGNTRVGVSGYAAGRNPINITTGLLIDGEGHIVTRLSNVDPTDKDQTISVTTSEGKTVKARLVGVDCSSGFTVLEATDLKTKAPEFPNFTALPEGTVVNIVSARVIASTVAPSNEVQFRPSLSVAQVYVSGGTAAPRPSLTVESPHLLARTDSGVAESQEGQIVGMVQFTGFGRAQLYPVSYISGTVARRVIEKNGSVPSAWLGVKGAGLGQLSESEWSQLGLKDRSGLFVQRVEPDSPAASSGVMPNDVIVAVDGIALKGPAEMSSILQWSAAGQTVKLDAVRAGKPTKLDVVLGARDFTLNDGQWVWPPVEQPEAAGTQRQSLTDAYKTLTSLEESYKRGLAERDSPQRAEELAELQREINALKQQLAGQPLLPNNVDRPAIEASVQSGFTVRELTPQLAIYFGVTGGLLVTTVKSDGAAALAGLKAGDIITAVDAKSSLTASQFASLVSSNQAAIKLSITRNKQTMMIDVVSR